MIKIQTKKLLCITLLLASFIGVKSQSTASLEVDFNKEIAPMKPVWSWFGADEPNYAYMKDGQKLLSELSNLSKNPVYFRAHNLLTSGDGTAALKWGSTNIYTEDKNGKPVYDFTIVDGFLIRTSNAASNRWRRSGLCPKLCPRTRSHTGITGSPAIRTTKLLPAGLIRQKVMKNGAIWCMNG